MECAMENGVQVSEEMVKFWERESFASCPSTTAVRRSRLFASAGVALPFSGGPLLLLAQVRNHSRRLV
jgi:hypothetical protein